MKITDRIQQLVLSRKPEISARSFKRDIATTCNVSYEAVRQWFAGDTGNIKNENLIAIAEGYDTTVDWLLSGKGEAPRRKASAAAKSSADIVKQMLAKHGKNLPEEARQGIAAAVAETASLQIPALLPAEGPGIERGEILIPQYDVRASMGHGQVPSDYQHVIRNLIVREELLKDKGVSYTSASALAVITGWGQSMEGTINDKDPVIVDRGVTEYSGEGIYVLTWHTDLLIKRVQRKDEDHFWLISDNPKNKDLEARMDDVTIHAKVLLVWNAKKV
ncbi:S24 family peptidase [Pseudomonas sp. R1-18]|uniref:XRE family transcriptional regulator n=1 Tax=Pseudomonas sp. R1-18 TaxID=1632772 RepID=UPI003DA9B1DA